MGRFLLKSLLCMGFAWHSMALAESQEAFESSLKKALSTIKQQQLEKTRITLSSLTEQVQSDLEPSKRMQAAILLAAHYWESNYRLSRHYLGIAESLRNPTAPELKSFDADIEHMKIRFRQAALLDADTKKELETQLRLNPPEPLRLSLVEMLLETNEALSLPKDFIATFKTYYSRYPRTVKKDRFLKRAADIYLASAEIPAYYLQLESLLDQYPVTDEAKWALDKLLSHSLTPDAPLPRYAFTYANLKKVYRNSSHDPAEQKRVLELVDKPLRKLANAPAAKLDSVELVKFYCYLQIYDEALRFAQVLLARPETLPKVKGELQNWIAYIYSERGDHSAALVQFQTAAEQLKADIFFQESEAKSFMSSQNFGAAATHYQALLKRKDYPRFRWYYFWNLLASGRIDNAQTYVSKQPDKMFTDGDYRQDAALYWQGRALLSAGKIELAKTTMQQLLERPIPGYYGVLAKTALTQGLAVAAKSQGNEIASQQVAPEGDTSSLTGKPILASFRSGESVEDSLKLQMRPESMPLFKQVFDVAKTMAVDPYLIFSVIRSESGFNAKALSPAGAQGLMQIMPYTAVRLARLLEDRDFRLDQLQSGESNLLYGSLYLALLLYYYDGHAIPAIAAYNAGPTVVNKWLKECRNCPVDAFVEFIPYAETRNYVKKVMSSYTNFRLNETHSVPEFLHKDLPSEFPKGMTIF